MDQSRNVARRAAGILIPLFSLRSERNWGIGDIADLEPYTAWLAEAHQGLLQVLPVNEISPGETSPYSSMSAFALDPLYIAVDQVEDFQELGGEAWLDGPRRERLERLRESPRVDYGGVRALKQETLEACFARFRQQKDDSARAAEFRRFLDEHADWIHDYALFRALHEQRNSHWESWEPELRKRAPEALEQERQALKERILFYQYLQWQAERQWQAARRAANARGVRLKGDLPFMVSGHSADVWAHQDQFSLDAWVGAPPDAFSAEGQNWGLPPYCWQAMATDDFSWIARRARRSSQIYDLYRIDHLVGFYRTYHIPRNGGRPQFVPAEEHEQRALGERIMRVFRSAGAEITAEDLGVIPHFVRRSLTELGIPGYRVLRWEKEWDEPGQPFRDPAGYPELSVAVSGTHDTETLAEWWEKMDARERRDACQIPALRVVSPEADIRLTRKVHRALLDALYGAGSRYVVLPVQDVFSLRGRINVPATIGPENWTYRFPIPISEHRIDARSVTAAEQIRALAERHHRTV